MKPIDIQSLYEALLSAFATPGELETMLYVRMGKNLSQFTAPAPLPETIMALIRRVEGDGETEKLLHAAHAEKPNNPKLQQFYWSYFGPPAGTGPGKTATQGQTPTAAQARKPRLVYCHAPKDNAFGAALERHLTMLVRNGLIERPWNEGLIRAGQVRQREIETAWNAADIIVMLLSADFLFAHDQDLQRAQRRCREGATIIPVIVRPVAWQDSPVGDMVVYPLDAGHEVKPVSKWSDQEDAWMNVADAVRAVVDSLAQPAQSP